METILVAALPLLGVLIGAALQYFFGRQMEIKRAIQMNKIQAYSDYLRSFSKLAGPSPGPQDLVDFIDAKTRICVYGSVNVIRALGEFERGGAKPSLPQNMTILANMVVWMREDVKSIGGNPEIRDIGAILFQQRYKPE